ncbi:hypothetical protein [Catellatospora vulcania]|uniref:hypothetical protein n=1 Tax=Catellatospora vulcania TaxID=1460450 RepID=UPI0012D3EDC3|nr:hypothetical protein [Catellatospora vulcania]
MTTERLRALLKETADIPIIAEPEEHYRSAQPLPAGSPERRHDRRESVPEPTMIAVSGQEVGSDSTI